MKLLALAALCLAALCAFAQMAMAPRPPALMPGLIRQNRTYDAQWVQQQFESAWRGADVQLKIEDL